MKQHEIPESWKAINKTLSAKRPGRKRRPYKSIDPTDPDQIERQLEKYVPGKFKRIE
jgi:hypothetical protein